MCEHIKLPGGGEGIICGLRRAKPLHCECGREAVALCDWKMPAKSSGTCDRPICALHTKRVARGKHLCPEHQRQYDDWKRRHPPAQRSLFEEAA